MTAVLRPLALVVLVDGVPTPEPDLMAWAEQVAADPVGRVDETTVGDVLVSTVFLYATDSFGNTFETMTFGGRWDHRCWRYPTRDAAVAGHAAIVEAVRRGGNPDDVAAGRW